MIWNSCKIPMRKPILWNHRYSVAGSLDQDDYWIAYRFHRLQQTVGAENPQANLMSESQQDILSYLKKILRPRKLNLVDLSSRIL